MIETDKQQTVFLFSGQGSQYRHMGKRLYDQNQVYRDSMHELDAIAHQKLGFSVLSELYSTAKNKGDAFDQTLLTHPAIFMFEVSLARALMASGIKPTAVIGVSLGEFAAAAIAGMACQKTLLSAVIESASIITDMCQTGGMMVILGDVHHYQSHLKRLGLSLAGVYLKDNFVISGTDQQLLQAQKMMKSLNIVCARLPVSHAFHSDEMKKCAQSLLKQWSSNAFSHSHMPFYSCDRAAVVEKLNPDHFVQVACNPILFSDTVDEYFIKNHHQQCHSTFIDIAPSGSLSTVVKAILKDKDNVDFKTIFSPYTDQIIDYKDVLLKEKPMLATTKNACLFPGQGAQIKGMGSQLFAKFPQQVNQANKILGWSVEDMCLNDPDGNLKQTLYTQPCLFVVNALAYLEHVKTHAQPDYVMGHSLGEYNALFAAGVITFEMGVKLVKKRAELMSKAPAGAMAAVIGLSAEQIQSTLNQHGLTQCFVANINSPTQIIISGDAGQIKSAKPFFTQAGCRAYIPLQVSGAFHSQLMQQAAVDFGEFLRTFNFKPARIQVVSNVTAQPYEDNVAELLQQQITQAVDWHNSVEWLLSQDVGEFIELSDKKVVSNMVKEIKQHWQNRPQLKNVEQEPEIVKKVHQPVVKTCLGHPDFMIDHQVTLPYVCGGMVHGIASAEMVIKCAKSGILSFLGTGALRPQQVERSIIKIKKALVNGETFGVNLLSGSKEQGNVAVFLKHGIKRIEAAAYIIPSEPLVHYRLCGLQRQGDQVVINHKVLAKLSRPEVAAQFLAPAPEKMVKKLLAQGLISKEQAELSKTIPLADDICVEADSGGHTDQGNTAILLPAIIKLRDEAMQKYTYKHFIRVGSAGGIGTPSSAASAFILGADFVLTGSINQCSVEAGTSDLVKSMLADMRVQDTAYAPAGDMFELGAKVQVLKRGVFFPARANRLYDLYSHHESLDEIDAKTIELLEKEYFKKSIAQVWQECCQYRSDEDINRALTNPKLYMAYIFKWYFAMTNRLALAGDSDRKVDFQIHTGPALGAFNQWVKGTALEKWQTRHVDDMAFALIQATEKLLSRATEKYQPIIREN